MAKKNYSLLSVRLGGKDYALTYNDENDFEIYNEQGIRRVPPELNGTELAETRAAIRADLTARGKS